MAVAVAGAGAAGGLGGVYGLGSSLRDFHIGNSPASSRLRVSCSIQLLLRETPATRQNRIAYRHYTQLNGSRAIGVVSFVGTVCVGHLVGSFQSLHFAVSVPLWPGKPLPKRGIRMLTMEYTCHSVNLRADGWERLNIDISAIYQSVISPFSIFQLWRVTCFHLLRVGSIGRL
jgi:hypothetical protein